MTYTLFAGCSFTAGSGFFLEKDEPDLWVNLVFDRFFAHTKKLNISTGGRSNSGIFQDTIWNMLHYPVDTAIVQWTSMPRYNIELGLETYETSQIFTPNVPCRDHHLNQINYSASYLNSIRDRFTSLPHDWYEIYNLIHYTNSIIACAEKIGTKVYFINGLCPWDSDFFSIKSDCRPSDYTTYTQKLINVVNRSDDQCRALYDKMHKQFKSAGGIKENFWINLYRSMMEQRTDVNSDGHHPGPISNKNFFDVFSRAFTGKTS